MADPTDPNSPIARVGGIWAGRDLQWAFQKEVAQLLGRENTRFPGAQPVSFAAKHLDELRRKDYYVCEKTDGERFLLWLTEDNGTPIVYFINRKNEYYFVRGFVFPHHEIKTGFHKDTILDGELVEDRHPDGRTEFTFLVFDMLIMDKRNLMDRTLDKRLGYFKEYVLKPFDQSGHGPFRVHDKITETAYGLEKMFHEVIPKVKQLHGNDGLIFTCVSTPYHPGTDQHILKWKPPQDNTIDFLLHIDWLKSTDTDTDEELTDYDALPDLGLYIFYDGTGTRDDPSDGFADYTRHGTLSLTEQEWADLKARGVPLQDAIVECYQGDLPTNGHTNGHGNGHTAPTWRLHRFRTDKVEANHISTFNSVIESIEDRVTQQDLLQHQSDIRDCWKERQAKGQKPLQGR